MMLLPLQMDRIPQKKRKILHQIPSFRVSKSVINGDVDIRESVVANQDFLIRFTLFLMCRGSILVFFAPVSGYGLITKSVMNFPLYTHYRSFKL